MYAGPPFESELTAGVNRLVMHTLNGWSTMQHVPFAGAALANANEAATASGNSTTSSFPMTPSPS